MKKKLAILISFLWLALMVQSQKPVKFPNNESLIFDFQPPDIHCPGNITQNNDPHMCGAIVHYVCTATDNTLVIALVSTPASGSFFPKGNTTVTTVAIDLFGNVAVGNFIVTVLDAEPPEINVVLNKNYLWPPNHKMADISALVTINDNCPGASYILKSVTSNEPEDGKGDCSQAPDIIGTSVGTSDNSFELRAERLGTGNGRDYSIVYEVSDASGNKTLDTQHVFVSHDQSNKSMANLTSSTKTDDGTKMILTDAINVYPNPTSNQLNIVVNNNTSIYNIKLIDFQGRVIKEKICGEEHSGTLYCNDVSKGIYMVLVNTSAGFIRKQVEIIK